MKSFVESQDYIIDDISELPYEHVGKLGHGQSGVVSKVRDVNTGRLFACKTIRVYGSRKNDDRKRIFDNEIAIIRSLKGHRHVVRVFATYVSRREVGLLLQPLANQGDLQDFLEDYMDADHSCQLKAETTAEETRVLLRAFGCLANGLAFMHQQKVRHKDIKPRNILIHKGMVIYTDFGYSLDCSALGQSTTEGRPEAYTQRYAAPEVLEHEKRNSRSDIFSLGCVFAEMLSAISEAFDMISLGCLSECIETLHTQLDDATSAIHPSLRYIIPVIVSMTSRDPSRRCTALQVADSTLGKPDFCCIFCRKISAVACSDDSIASLRSEEVIISEYFLLYGEFLHLSKQRQEGAWNDSLQSTYEHVLEKMSVLRLERFPK